MAARFPAGAPAKRARVSAHGAGGTALIVNTTEAVPLADTTPRSRPGPLRSGLRAIAAARRHQITHLAQAVAFNGFLAIPSALLLALGVFGAVASPGSVTTLLDHLSGVVPTAVLDLVRQSLRQVVASRRSGIMIAVGAALAAWSLMGAMQTVIWSLNAAHGRDETRGALRVRLVSLLMAACVVLAVTLIVGALVLGGVVSGWIDRTTGITGITWVWEIGRFPVMVAGLLAACACLLHLGPDAPDRRFRLITPGAVVTIIVWLIVSGGFAFYANSFSSYNKAWGSLAAVIVTLTWLWLSSLALLFGAEVDATVERGAGDESETPPLLLS
jgi:membrane protein